MSQKLNHYPHKKGYVFNIQQFSLHDGPGIRTTVFLKGCPLRCSWCSNPESQELHPELAYNDNNCLTTAKCRRCIQSCNYGSLTTADDGTICVNRKTCSKCFQCVLSCPSNALSIYGKLMSVDEVLKAVEKDSLFYARSGGGLSLSGGEPLFQAEFTIALLTEAKSRRLNTTMETCGFTEWSYLDQACQYLNTIIYDIKCMDGDKHKIYSGSSNALILNNFSKLCKQYPNLPKIIRTPVIPAFNDNEADIQNILEYLKDKPNIRYELLPYHRLGQSKYEYLGREYPYENIKLCENKFLELEKMVKSFFS